MTTQGEPVKVLIAEDMRILRRALVSLLALEPDIEVVAEVETGTAVLPQALSKRPDVAVLDIDMPGVDGITAAAMLSSELPQCRTVILTALGRPGHLQRAMRAGVSGFLLKDIEPDRLAGVIRSVVEGERVIDPDLVLHTLEARQNPLTAREVQVLSLAARGEDVPRIAKRLSLSPGTVSNYLSTVVTKLNARNRVDAIRIAQEADWI